MTLLYKICFYYKTQNVSTLEEFGSHKQPLCQMARETVGSPSVGWIWLRIISECRVLSHKFLTPVSITQSREVVCFALRTLPVIVALFQNTRPPNPFVHLRPVTTRLLVSIFKIWKLFFHFHYLVHCHQLSPFEFLHSRGYCCAPHQVLPSTNVMCLGPGLTRDTCRCRVVVLSQEVSPFHSGSPKDTKP